MRKVHSTLPATVKTLFWNNYENSHEGFYHTIPYSQLAADSYSLDAVYFGNGSRSDGTPGIVGRYYAGERKDNPGGLYTILWQKSEEEQLENSARLQFLITPKTKKARLKKPGLKQKIGNC